MKIFQLFQFTTTVSAQTKSILSFFSKDPNAIAIDSTKTTIFVATENVIKSYDSISGNDLKLDFVGHTAPINFILLSGNQMFTASKDNSIKLWDTSTRNLIRTFNGNTEEVWKVAIDGKNLISGAGDETIRIFDISSGELIRTIPGAHHQRVASLALTKDYLYTAGFDSIAKEVILK